MPYIVQETCEPVELVFIVGYFKPRIAAQGVQNTTRNMINPNRMGQT